MRNEPSVSGQVRKPGIGSAIRRIAAALGAAALLLVLAAPAGAATKTPFKAHGVFVSCGHGDRASTTFMTFLALRNERGFDDVKALLGHADEVRPRGAKLRVPGQDRDRKLGSIGASLPDFLFIDYLETNAGPGAAARERSTISWRSKKSSGKRVRTSVRLNDLGDEFCEPGKGKSADRERMLREAAPAPESDAESTPTEPETYGASGRDAAERQPRSVQCPAGTYYGRADDGTEISLSYDGGSGFSQIQARASDKGVSYDVRLPDGIATTLFGTFVTGVPASQTELGYSPAATMHGGCSEQDRFKVTLSDRAGGRTATLSRVVLEPGYYEGSVWESRFAPRYSDMKIHFRVEPGTECQDCPGAGTGFWLNGPRFTGLLDPQLANHPKVKDEVNAYVWLAPQNQGSRWVSAGCQLGFTAYRGNRLRTRTDRLKATGSCERGNRVSGQMVDVADDDTPWSTASAYLLNLSWEARRVDD